MRFGLRILGNLREKKRKIENERRAKFVEGSWTCRECSRDAEDCSYCHIIVRSRVEPHLSWHCQPRPSSQSKSPELFSLKSFSMSFYTDMADARSAYQRESIE